MCKHPSWLRCWEIVQEYLVPPILLLEKSDTHIMKKTLLIVSVAFLALFGSLQLYVYLSRPTPAGELRVKVANMPALSLKDRQGNEFTIPTGKPVVLIYFNSTCDHCQRQMMGTFTT